MKKRIITSLFIIVAFISNAQAFEAKNFNIDFGYALGSHRSFFYSPGVLVNFDKGVHKWISVGAYTGYQYSIGVGSFYPLGGNSSYRAHSVPVGAFGSFHFYQMISDLVGKDIKADKLDLAIKHSFGARLDFEPNTFSPHFDWGTSVMARYYVSELFGIYAEVGYPAMGNLVIGGSLRF